MRELAMSGAQRCSSSTLHVPPADVGARQFASAGLCSQLQLMTRPFVTGDHVQLVNQEGVEVEVCVW